MSGSSLDGIDIVLTSFDRSAWQLDSSETIPLPSELKHRLKTSIDQSALELAKTESLFSKFVADCLTQFIGSSKVDLVGIHGHTVLHLPEISTSWQLLNGGMIAALTNLPVVCDFRNQDLALGGQGTPMAVIADRDLYPGHDYYINLGGIANISYRSKGKWMAYDLCACNQLLNYFSQQAGQEYDRGGLLAQAGTINTELLNLLLNEAYILAPPPKSLDNSYIQSYLIDKIEKHQLDNTGYLRTIVEFIAEVIFNSTANQPGSLFLSGGGSKNEFLTTTLKKKISTKQQSVFMPDEKTIDYKEAILIAYCSYLRVQEKVNFISEATGAKNDVIGGAVYLPPSTLDS